LYGTLLSVVVEMAVLVSTLTAPSIRAIVRGNWKGKVEVTNCCPTGTSYPVRVR
jgi:hypothetical protein